MFWDANKKGREKSIKIFRNWRFPSSHTNWVRWQNGAQLVNSERKTCFELIIATRSFRTVARLESSKIDVSGFFLLFRSKLQSLMLLFECMWRSSSECDWAMTLWKTSSLFLRLLMFNDEFSLRLIQRWLWLKVICALFALNLFDYIIFTKIFLQLRQ